MSGPAVASHLRSAWGRLGLWSIFALAAGLGAGWCVAGPHLFDSGELVAAAWQLQGSHPPGQPLHALLGHGLAQLSLGPVSWRIAWLSWLLTLATALATGQLARTLVSATAPVTAPLKAHWTAGAVAAVGALTTLPVARQATRPEVYALAACLSMLALRQLVLGAWQPVRPRIAHLCRAALLTSTLMAVHPPHALTMVWAAVLLFAAPLLQDPSLRRGLLWVLPAGLLPLGIYAYLPLRAAAGAQMWGEPDTLAGLWRIVSGQDYGVNLGLGDSSIGTRLLPWGVYFAQAGGALALLGVVGALAGGGAQARRRWGLGILGALGMLAAAGMQGLVELNPDNVAYSNPALLWTGALGAAAWCQVGLQSAPQRDMATPGGGRKVRLRRATLGSWRRAVAALALGLMALHPMAWPKLGDGLRAAAPSLHSAALAWLETPPSRALVLVESDMVASLWWQARAVAGARPDVALAVTGLATSSWHWRQLGAHPALVGKAVRGPAKDPHQAYVQGMVWRALGRVAVLSERDAPLLGRGQVWGPYLMWSADARQYRTGVALAAGAGQHRPAPGQKAQGPSRAQTRGTALMRLWRLEQAQDTPGDHALVQRVWRQAATQWLWRRWRRHDGPVSPGAWQALLPGAGRALPWRRLDSGPKRPLPPVVDTVGAFVGDVAWAERHVAVALWSVGARRHSEALLETQLQQGEIEALLQLAWLRAFEGQRPLANTLLQRYQQIAPARAKGAAAPLAAWLQPAPPHSRTGP